MKHEFLIIADMHYSISGQMAEATWILKWFGGLFPKFARRCEQGAAIHIKETLREAAEHGPYAAGIDLGDRTHGSHKDTGLKTKHAADEARGALQILKDVFNGLEFFLVPGNHDKGWHLSSFTRWGNGYLQDSLTKYREIYGPLYGITSLTEEVNLIWLSSEPFFFDYKRSIRFGKGKREEKKSRERLQLLRSELAIQLDFVKNQLANVANHDRKFILAVHEPSTLLSPQLQSILDEHRDRLIVTLTGHVHARWLMNLLKLFRPALHRIFSRYKIQMIPSVWGIDLPVPGLAWGPGAGWAKLTIEDGRVMLYIFHTNKRRFRGIRL
ncbi:MAG: metallophosphoesterase [Candidatus Buchananbacteria bacterium]